MSCFHKKSFTVGVRKYIFASKAVFFKNITKNLSTPRGEALAVFLLFKCEIKDCHTRHTM